LRFLKRIKNEHTRAINAVRVNSPRGRFIDLAIAAIGETGVFTDREDRRLTKMIEQLDGPSADRVVDAANETWRAVVKAARRRVEEIDDRRLWKLCELVEQKLNRASTLVEVEVEVEVFEVAAM